MAFVAISETFDSESPENVLPQFIQLNTTSIKLMNDNNLVTWTEQDVNNKWSIIGQIYSEASLKINSEFVIASEFLNGEEQRWQPRDFSVTTLFDGGFVASWSHVTGFLGAGGMVTRSKFQICSDNGSPVSEVSTSASASSKTTVAALSDGGFLFISEDIHTGLWGTKYNSSGFLTGDEVNLGFFNARESNPSIAYLKDGGFVLVADKWHTEPEVDAINQNSAVYGQIFNGAGNPIGQEFRMNTEGYSFQDHPSVTSLSDGGFIVAWVSSLQDGNGIFGQLFSEGGDKVGIEFQINTQTTYDQHSPNVSSLSERGGLVTWTWNYNRGTYGQLFGSGGTKLGGEFLVYSQAERAALTENGTLIGSVDLTEVTGGGFVITWETPC